MRKLTMILVLAVGLGTVVTPASGLTKAVGAPVTKEMPAQPDAYLMNLIEQQLAPADATNPPITVDSVEQNLEEEFEVYQDLVRSGAVDRAAELAKRLEESELLNEACAAAMSSKGVISGAVPLAETPCRRREGGGVPTPGMGGGGRPGAGSDPNCTRIAPPASHRGYAQDVGAAPRATHCTADGTTCTRDEIASDGSVRATEWTHRADGSVSRSVEREYDSDGKLVRSSREEYGTDGSIVFAREKTFDYEQGIVHIVDTNYGADGSTRERRYTNREGAPETVVFGHAIGPGPEPRTVTVAPFTFYLRRSPNARRPVDHSRRPVQPSTDTPRVGDEPGLDDEQLADLLTDFRCSPDKQERFENALWESFGGSPDVEYTEECQSPVEGESMDDGEGAARPCLYPTREPEEPVVGEGCGSDSTPCFNDGNGLGPDRQLPQGTFESLAGEFAELMGLCQVDGCGIPQY